MTGQGAPLSAGHDVRRLIEQDLNRPLQDVGNADSLLETGVLDSVSVLQLVSLLEEQFGIAISEDELMPDNFETIDAIDAFLQRRLAPRN